LAGKTSYQANQNFIQPIGLCLSCVTKDLIVASKPDANQLRVLSTKDGEPFKLKGTPLTYLLVVIRYKITEATGERGPFKASTVAYNYTVYSRNKAEMLAFHWHPNLGPRYPHLHLYQGSGIAARLIKKHIPTDRISLEEVLRFLIEELGIEPLTDKWDEVLTSTYEKYKKYRTWPV
jgi:hypothetical protein